MLKGLLKFGWSIFFLTSHLLVYSQSSFGGYPSKIKWHQINTDYVRVIYPDSLEEKAQRLANIIHYMNDNNVGLLGEKRKKVPIILRSEQVISNGYAQVAPFKSEFFMAPPQLTYQESSLDWLDLLALHEYRHTNQFANNRRWVGNLAHAIFGDYGWAGVIGLASPAWFLEGDAVVNETALSSGGRGRIPSFTAMQRAQLNEGVDYSYMKMMNGSFKDFVPNHYNIGYLICSEIRRTNGNDSWDKITKRSANLHGIIGAFDKSIKKETGLKVKQHYKNAQEKLGNSIPKLLDDSKIITSDEKNNVVSYDNPIIENGEIYFSYSSRRELSGIYKLLENNEKELIVNQGLILDSYFDKNDSLYVWNEIQRDIRRNNQNYSNIILYNANQKTKKIIGRGSSYFSPSFNHKGNLLVFADNNTTNGSFSLTTLDFEKDEINKIITSKSIQFLYPIFSKDDQSIYTIAKEDDKFAIVKMDQNAKFELLTQWDNVVFGPLKLSGDYILFQANFDAIDNVYGLNVISKEIFKVSEDAIGMYNPSNLENGKIIVSKPHSRGFLLHQVDAKPEEWIKISKTRSSDLPYYLETEHLEGRNILSEVSNHKFETSLYPADAKILKFHSWLLNTDGTEFSATLFSENILNNVNIQPKYRYNSNVKGSYLDVNINYGKWFPIYQFQYSYALPRIQKSSNGARSFDVSQQSVRPGVIIPLNFSRGIYSTTLNFNNSVTLQATKIQELGNTNNFDQNNVALNNLVSFRKTRLKPLQAFYPKWGIISTVYNRHRFDDDHNILSITNDAYVPGFHPNHGFKFELDYQRKNATAEDRIDMVDGFNYAAGFISVPYDEIIGLNTNYGFPLAYPDWGFWNLIYFKRINSVMFHNFNQVSFEKKSTILQSAGLDLLFDMVFANNVFSEITVGFKNAYMLGPLPEGKKSRFHFELIFEIPAF